MKSTNTNTTIKVSHRLSIAEVERRKGDYGNYNFYTELEEIGGGTVIFTGKKAEADALKYLKSLHKNRELAERLQCLPYGKTVKLTVAVNGELPAMPCSLLPAVIQNFEVFNFAPAVCEVETAPEVIEAPAVIEKPARVKRSRPAKVIQLTEVKPASTVWQIAI